MNKICSTCGIEKEISNYQKDIKNKDGYKGRCKKCISNYNKNYQIEYIREQTPESLLSHAEAQARFRKTPKYREAKARYRKTYRSSETFKRLRIAYTSRWRAKNKVKNSAHGAVSRAIHSGKLQKGKCEICSSEKVVAHHDDYSKPLEVRWLCTKHHIEIHCKPNYNKVMEVNW